MDSPAKTKRIFKKRQIVGGNQAGSVAAPAAAVGVTPVAGAGETPLEDLGAPPAAVVAARRWTHRSEGRARPFPCSWGPGHCLAAATLPSIRLPIRRVLGWGRDEPFWHTDECP
jgi:hypothetical protein